jgi:hypothetical protein
MDVFCKGGEPSRTKLLKVGVNVIYWTQVEKVLVTEEHSPSRQGLTRLSCFMLPVSYRIQSFTYSNLK